MKDTEKHKFWSTQPVEGAAEEKRGTYAGRLPEGLEFRTVKIEAEIDAVYELLAENYVEDSLSMFRLEYSKEFLIWQMKIPGSKPEWNVGLFRGKEMIGFISASNLQMRIHKEEPGTVLVNFLCVRRDFRKQGLAPALISEVTRRVNESGIFKAVFTASEKLPFIYADARYYHRLLNPERLVERRFCRERDVLTLPPVACGKGPRLRPVQPHELDQVFLLYTKKYGKMEMFVDFTREQFEYIFTPRKGLLECLVSDDLAEFAALFFLDTRVICEEYDKAAEKDRIYTAYLYYHSCAGSDTSYANLINGVMQYLQERKLCDVFNALDLEENTRDRLESLGFLRGDGVLYFYLFNWRVPKTPHGANGLLFF